MNIVIKPSLSIKKKYNIENNLDFFKELEDSIDTEESTTKSCLITNEPYQEESGITLSCSHSFNYIPLFKNFFHQYGLICRQYSQIQHNSHNRFYCPYCRNPQIKGFVLPYDEKYGFNKLRGLNTLEPTQNVKKWYENILHLTKCQFVNNDGVNCCVSNSFNYFNDCYLCVNHYYISRLDEAKRIKHEKQKIKNEKQKVKDERKRIREEKLKMKKEKQEKAKEEKQEKQEKQKKAKEEKQEKLNQPFQKPL